jgi:hypothetical protein
MSISPKHIQLNLFIQEKEKLEQSVKEETLESLKKQVRMLFHMMHEWQRKVQKHEEMISSLVDLALEAPQEKSPDQGLIQGQ